MAGGGPGNSSGGNVFQARLNTALGGQSNTLTLLPYKGNQILVGGRVVTVPSLGLTRLVTDNIISGSGADSGSPGIANSLYYVYVSNNLATFSPSSIRLSSTPPVLVNGVKYLGGSGNSLNWRFVGWVYLNATPAFEFSPTNALIINYYNRLLLSVFANPGYVDDNAETTYAIPGTATWAAANGGVGSQIKFISNGEDYISFTANASVIVNGADVWVGSGIDGAAPLNSAKTGNGALNKTGLVANEDDLISEGFHTVDLFFAADVGATAVADFVRNGAAHDPRGSLVLVAIYG